MLPLKGVILSCTVTILRFYFLLMHELCFLSNVSFCPGLCVFTATSATGINYHASPVFSPTDPDTSIEDCLAAMGDRVARELDTRLTTAVHTLLAGSVCKAVTMFELTTHTMNFSSKDNKKKKITSTEVMLNLHHTSL